MLSDKAFMALCDIRDNVLFARQLLSGVDYQAFKASRTLFYAATRALEIISEAPLQIGSQLQNPVRCPLQQVYKSQKRFPSSSGRDIIESQSLIRAAALVVTIVNDVAVGIGGNLVGLPRHHAARISLSPPYFLEGRSRECSGR
jgi:hypothetical protein